MSLSSKKFLRNLVIIIDINIINGITDIINDNIPFQAIPII